MKSFKDLIKNTNTQNNLNEASIPTKLNLKASFLKILLGEKKIQDDDFSLKLGDFDLKILRDGEIRLNLNPSYVIKGKGDKNGSGFYNNGKIEILSEGYKETLYIDVPSNFDDFILRSLGVELRANINLVNFSENDLDLIEKEFTKTLEQAGKEFYSIVKRNLINFTEDFTFIKQLFKDYNIR